MESLAKEQLYYESLPADGEKIYDSYKLAAQKLFRNVGNKDIIHTLAKEADEGAILWHELCRCCQDIVTDEGNGDE
jgi:hypothetical protein